MDKVGVGDGGTLRGASIPSPTQSKRWKVPILPPSMNRLYAINFRTRSVYMTPEARTFKTQFKMFITPFTVSSNDKLTMSLDVYTDWFFKNGKQKRADIQNLIKVVLDAVSERLGFDDSQVWSFTASKIQSTENCCFVTLEKQNEDRSHVEKVECVEKR